MGRREILEDVERDTKSLNQSLASQLGHARRTKVALEQGNPILKNDSLEDPADVKKALEETVHIAQLQQDCIKKLRFELEMENGQINILRHENQRLRQLTEYISNTLLKRISDLKKEKGELLQQVEQEEEYLTNTLQRKLEKLQQEKIDLENALEREQEFVVNKLQKQLDGLRMQQSPGREASSGSASATNISSPIVNGARIKISELEKDLITLHNQAGAYRKELIELRRKTGLPIIIIMLLFIRLHSIRHPIISRQRSTSSVSGNRSDSNITETPRTTRSGSSNNGSIHNEPRFSQSVPDLAQPILKPNASPSSISKRRSMGYDAR
ncbi:hypothetical protein BDF22DRAFT_686732 [Syncephalis plumigaleata]|nr:hypothetical protein BDF22DRAFT_686732 [Syncephalis plumigaleata]